jgi:lipoprotein-anchoring transpeptidase ErfK/SrfK
MMIRPLSMLLLALPVAVAVSGMPAQAQNYYPPQQPYYRQVAPPPDGYQERLPPPGYLADDADDPNNAPLMLSPRMSQARPGEPQRVLPYPDEADALPPSGSCGSGPCAAYGHQLDAPPQPVAPAPAVRPAMADPDAPRPPGSVGNAPQNTPQSTPQAAPPAAPVGTAALPPEDQPEVGQPKQLPDSLRRQLVEYPTHEPAGTIIVDTAHTYLYLVLGGGKALRYGVRVGREGFTWTGTERISKMKEWPDWFPPPEMIERQPYLPRMMAGGPGNPLGARAMYLGHTLYRIHGTNQPSTIGHYVSSGCVGMLNDDVEDLYSRVQVGSRVVVLPGNVPETAANTDAPPAPANPMAPPSHGTAVSGAPQPALR